MSFAITPSVQSPKAFAEQNLRGTNLVNRATGAEYAARMSEAEILARLSAGGVYDKLAIPTPVDLSKFGCAPGNSAAANTAALEDAIDAGFNTLVLGPSHDWEFEPFVLPSWTRLRGAGRLATWITFPGNNAYCIAMGTAVKSGTPNYGIELSDFAMFSDNKQTNFILSMENQQCCVERIYIEGTHPDNLGGCTGITIDGGDASSFFNEFKQVSIYKINTGILVTGSGSVIATQQYFRGCNIDGDVSTDAGSVGLEVRASPNGGNGQNIHWTGGNLEHCGKGLLLAAGYCTFLGIRTEANTNDVVHSAGSSPQTFLGGLLDDTKIQDNSGAGYERHVYLNVVRPDGTRWSRVPGPHLYRSSVSGEVPINVQAYPSATTDLLYRAQSSGAGLLWGVDSEGTVRKQNFRSGSATPVGAVTPLFVGEIYFETSTPKHYIANGAGNTAWAALY